MSWPRYRKQASLGAKEFHGYWRDRAYFFFFFLTTHPGQGIGLSFKCERLLFVVFFLCYPKRRQWRNTTNKGKSTGITDINRGPSSVTSSHPHTQRKYFKIKMYFKREEQKGDKLTVIICKRVNIN